MLLRETVKNAFALAAMIIIFVGPVPAEEKLGTLPKDIVAILDHDYPGWSLIRNSNVIREPVLSHLNLDTTQTHPNLVWGDFDGDGRQDYAVLVEREADSVREQLLVAFVAKGKSFHTHLIKRAVRPAYIAEYIWLAEKGSRYYDHEAEGYLYLANDGIEAVIIEKAAVTYVYDRGAFRAITAAD